MRLETRSAILDMRRAIALILSALEGKDRTDYESDWLLQSAVERQLSILGEALNRVKSFDVAVFAAIPDGPKIIGLRNVLVHGYDAVSSGVTWSVSTEHLSKLDAYLESLGMDSG